MSLVASSAIQLNTSSTEPSVNSTTFSPGTLSSSLETTTTGTEASQPLTPSPQSSGIITPSNTESGPGSIPTPIPTFPNTTMIIPSPTSLTPLCTPAASASAEPGILDNGDFEAGLSPWSLDLVDLFSTAYALQSRAGANGSCTAFVVTMLANPQTQDLRENLRLRSDLVFSLPGALLRVSFYVRFAQRNAARLELSANDESLTVVSALDYGPGGSGTGSGSGILPNTSSVLHTRGGRGDIAEKFQFKGKAHLGTLPVYKNHKNDDDDDDDTEGDWTLIELDYLARDRLLQLTFSYQLDSASGNTIWLDQVAIVPSGGTRPALPLPLPSSSSSSSSSSLQSSSPLPTTLATTLRSVVVGASR
ncbi:hypothetical protein GGR50DRAFT_706858 [Xylaria sp. CBS 124048]|nr:hypothetical protein GGR50DRAFT_706858 [Xylaria sp. CBS 124048]